jgi:hypothetical protein
MQLDMINTPVFSNISLCIIDSLNAGGVLLFLNCGVVFNSGFLLFLHEAIKFKVFTL